MVLIAVHEPEESFGNRRKLARPTGEAGETTPRPDSQPMPIAASPPTTTPATGPAGRSATATIAPNSATSSPVAATASPRRSSHGRSPRQPIEPIRQITITAKRQRRHRPRGRQRRLGQRAGDHPAITDRPCGRLVGDHLHGTNHSSGPTADW
jgi:hypothetical protein